MAWDGATWTQIATANAPSPRAASGPAMSNDPLTGHIDQFGGFDGFLVSGHNLALVRDQLDSGANRRRPLRPRGAGIAVYDPVHNNVVLWGGLADLNPLNTDL